jgi:hypothetical protein
MTNGLSKNASFFPGPPLPASWTRVGRFKIKYPYFLGADTVSFYSVKAEEKNGLKKALHEFLPQLPPEV